MSNIIKNEMYKSDINIKKMSELSNISMPTIVKIKKGIKTVSLAKYLKVLSVLGLTFKIVKKSDSNHLINQ